MSDKSISITPLLLLISLSLFWGLNWPGMKIILNQVPVWWFRGSCLVVGGSILLLLSAASGNRWKMRRNEVGQVLFCAIFAIFGWMIFSAYGVSKMPAGRASIIAFTMPLWATVFSAVLLKEKIALRKVVALILGLMGLGFLIGTDLFLLKQFPTGAIFMLLAATSWAFGTVLIKRGNWQLPIISNVAWQLLFSAIPMLLIAITIEPFPDVSSFSVPVWLALLYIYLFPMSYCQWAYFKVVSLLPASVAAIGTLLVPVVGVYSSYLILNEQVGIAELVALGLILAALCLVLFSTKTNSR